MAESFSRVLVANRGEIARRVFASCRRQGLSPVAVFADDDADSPYVREADLAVRLPGDGLDRTYLNVAALLEAARKAGAQAIYPGYGLLSENAEFARAVQAAGLVWIGPPADAIARMGSKIEAKRLMAEAGVPVLPAWDPEVLLCGGAQTGFPLLVKAAAGGGGRGMRIVASLAELDAELSGARAEALAAFGDSTVFCEPYLAAGHHVEVQVLADRHGTVWAVGERECSIQRRYQKILEESPSPLVERIPGLREKLFAAAVSAARAVGYVGAGTVEFLVAPSGEFHFLEMNTRIQVEHPVTECTTGLDLVRLQFSIAAGTPLAATAPAPSGHAIEVRLYAENPARDWQPQTGTVHRLRIPGVSVEFGPLDKPGLRLDSGVLAGSVVRVRYDPMLAKLIAWAPERAEAAAMLATALARAEIAGVGTNRDLLVRTLRHPDFLAGSTDTGFLDRHRQLFQPLADRRAEALAALAAALSDAAASRGAGTLLPGVPGGWRNVVSQPRRTSYRTADGSRHEIEYHLDREGLRAAGFPGLRLVSAGPDEVVLEDDGLRHAFRVARFDGLVYLDSILGAVVLSPVPRLPEPAAATAAGSLFAPMPGSVVRIAVSAGDQVAAGQPLLWLEAMKMQHPVLAPVAGTVLELPITLDQQVELGSVLAVLSGADSGTGSESA
ncbi:MAG: propionyl-CoA carboxylase alpha chain [Pseudonocardiales bacterium]|jgi:propionyl-CoA carboxylase alpha chain|nr:propionyl-CoA carboxylase alpha chain [Pseudonocardiales bacterium]